VEVFRWVLLFGLARSDPLWMYAIGFRSKRVLIISGMVLVVSSFPAVLEFHMQNLAALVIFFLAAAAVRNWPALSGFLLALATTKTKPETSGLMIVWLLLWATARWPERTPCRELCGNDGGSVYRGGDRGSALDRKVPDGCPRMS
jgi:uncharacterized membrane protein